MIAAAEQSTSLHEIAIGNFAKLWRKRVDQPLRLLGQWLRSLVAFESFRVPARH